MVNTIFSQFQEIQKVFFLKENKFKKAMYYIFGFLFFGFPFYLFEKYESLQIFIYDLVEDIKDADYILLKYEKGQDIILLDFNQVKSQPYIESQELITCIYHHQKFYYDEEQNKFKRIGKLFPKFVTEQQENIFKQIKALDEKTVEELRKTYGENIFKNEYPSFLQSLKKYISQPFIFILYFLFVVNLIIGKYFYASFVLFILALNFYFQRKIRLKEISNANQLSQHPQQINVFREIDAQVKQIEISDTQLVIGDIIEIFNEKVIHADVLILQGRAIVDESALTGESFPVIKTNYEKYKIKNENIILSGSRVLETQNHKVYAIVLRTSWDSFQGQFICSVGKKTQNPIELEQFILKLYLMFFLFSCVFYFIRIYLFIQQNLTISLRSELFLILQQIEATFPMSSFFSIYFCEYINSENLSKQQIQKLTSKFLLNVARVKQICYDKTGTLTEQDTNFHRLIVSYDKEVYEPFENIENLRDDFQSRKILEVFLCCNSLIKLEGVIKGEPIEAEMFKKTKSDIETQIIETQQKEKNKLNFLPEENKKKIKKIVKINDFYKQKYNIQDDYLECAKTFQFDSKKKRMGVIIKNIKNQEQQEYTYLCKGAPEKIISLCKEDSIPDGLHEKINHFSKQGYRILAIAYNEIKDFDVQQKDCEKDMMYLGFVVFKNQLKKDTQKYINELSSFNYNLCMITGDSLETSVSIGYQSGIIKQNQKVYIGKFIKKNKKVVWFDYENIIQSLKVKDFLSQSSYNVQSNIQFSSIKDDVYQQLQDKIKICQQHNCVLAIDGDLFDYYLDRIDEQNVRTQLMQQTKIFARCKPEQKQRIVKNFRQQLFKKKMQVAFVGDGANDSYALKEADVGLSIGQSFTGLSTFICQKDDISKFKEILIEAKFSFEATKNYQIIMFFSTLLKVSLMVALPFFYQNYGGFEYFIRYITYIELPFIFLLGSSQKLTSSLPSYKFIDRKNIFYIISNSVTIILAMFIALYYLFSSDLYKSPEEIVSNTQDIDYTQGEQYLFIEKKYMCYIYMIIKYHYRQIHRVGQPYGKGINIRSLGLLFVEIGLFIFYWGIFFLDNITENYLLEKFHVQNIRMPKYTVKQKIKYVAMIYTVVVVSWMSLWSIEKYSYKKDLQKTKKSSNFKNKIVVQQFQMNKNNEKDSINPKSKVHGEDLGVIRYPSMDNQQQQKDKNDLKGNQKLENKIRMQQVENQTNENEKPKRFIDSQIEEKLRKDAETQNIYDKSTAKDLLRIKMISFAKFFFLRSSVYYLQQIFVFLVIILIYKDIVQSFSYIFLVRSLLYIIYFLMDVFLGFKFKNDPSVAQKFYIVLSILDFVDFFAYFIIFIYLKFGVFRIGTMVLIFTHLAATIFGYCNNEEVKLNIFRSAKTSLLESIILIVFVFKICRNTNPDIYSWSSTLILYAITAYISISITGFLVFIFLMIILCLMLTKVGRQKVIKIFRGWKLQVYIIFWVYQSVIYFLFYYGFDKVAKEEWINSQVEVGQIQSQILYGVSIFGLVCSSIFFILMSIINKSLIKQIQNVYFKLQEDKAGKIQLISFTQAIKLEAQQMSGNYFKPGKEDDSKYSDKLKELNQLEECIICYEDKANCLQDPCGHIVTCQKCQIEILKKNNKLCINCKNTIEKVYIIQEEKNNQGLKITGILQIND